MESVIETIQGENAEFEEDLGWDNDPENESEKEKIVEEKEEDSNTEDEASVSLKEKDEEKDKEETEPSTFIMTNNIILNRRKTPTLREEDHSHLATLIRIMKALPIKDISEKEIENFDFFLFNEPIDLLLGSPPPSLIEIYHNSHNQTDNANAETPCVLCESVDFRSILLDATHVLNCGMKEVFNYLSSNEKTEIKELEFLEEAGRTVRFVPSIVPLLLDIMDTYTHRVRSEWSATYVKTIHVLLNIFGHRRKELAKVIGNDASVLNEKIAALDHSSLYKNFANTYRDVIKGKGTYYPAFVVEVLYLMVCDRVRSSPTPQPYLHEIISNAGYHQVRCAVDTLSAKIFYVCLLSPTYFADVWLPYMRFYHPYICPNDNLQKKEEDKEEIVETCPPTTFYETIVFYYPSTDVIIPPDTEKMSETIEAIFHRYISNEFKKGITTSIFPEGFPSENIARLFGKTRATRAKRSSFSSSSSSSSS